MMTIEQKLRQIVTETFLVGDEIGELPGDASFIEMGIIDSTGILQLVEFVEREFGIRVDDEDLVPENLDSINQLAAFIGRKKQPSTADTATFAADSMSAELMV